MLDDGKVDWVLLATIAYLSFCGFVTLLSLL